MLAQIITENGQKKIVPLTADAGAGNPVGTIIVVCSNRVPSNYLPLGTQYDTTQYPLLYAELGTDTTPTASSLNLPTLTSGQYAIKATSGLPENQQENVLATINENNSYSTTEQPTGAKWIDGKPIYRKVIDCGALPNATSKAIAHNITNISRIINVSGIAYRSNNNTFIQLPFVSTNSIELNCNLTSINIITNGNYSNYGESFIILEYTKTTD